jgi:hypothetical protein
VRPTWSRVCPPPLHSTNNDGRDPADLLLFHWRFLLAGASSSYLTAFGHPEGIGAQPWFTIRGDKLYPAFGHPEGIGAQPWFTIRGDQLYPAFGHPEGIGAQPWFTVRDDKLYPAFGHPEGIGAIRRSL